ncbi:hypothetical protein HYX08_07285 [Candidatus Woesearchaeota archaeon]|nr:hypothetical protein [Candidatus Woesearchaeota archaeon]
MLNLKLDLENIYLISVFSLLLFLGYANLVDHSLGHDFPYGYFASDAFQHQTRVEWIKDEGNYRNEAPYIVFGIRDVIGYYPPVIYHLSVLLSYASGLETYDTLQFMVFFAAAIAAIVMYFIIRNFSKNVAILSMPLAVLLFYNGIYTGFTWGHWPSLLSQFFLVAFFWYAANIDLKHSFIFFAVFLSAIILTHTAEAIFAAMFFAIFLAYKLLRKEFSLGIIKNAVYGSIITVVATFNFLVIFKLVWAVRQPFELSIKRAWDAPLMFFGDFGLLLVFFAAGIIVSLTWLRKKDMLPFVIAASMLLFSYTNYIGFDTRAFQLRFFWPVYLSFLLGLGIFYIANTLYRNWKILHSVIASVALIIVLTTASFAFIPGYKKMTAQGIMDNFHWQAFQWLGKSTDNSARVYFFYGDMYGQDAVLRNAKRLHGLIVPEDYADAISKRELRRFYETEMPGDGGGGAVQRPSFFSFHFAADDIRNDLSGKKDICSFDYLVFDKTSGQQAFAQYNLLLANELLKKNFISPVFENQLVVILKNKNPGEDCIEERNF